MNAFESGQRKVIPAVLVYVYRQSPSGLKEVLMLERKHVGDFHQGKWNGLGGKCETDESVTQAALREVQEESGLVLEPSDLKPLGTIHFPNFKPHKNEDWWVTVFRADLRISSCTSIPPETAEGGLHWVAENQILERSLWPGDRLFLPSVFALQPFIGTIWYENGKVAQSELLTY